MPRPPRRSNSCERVPRIPPFPRPRQRQGPAAIGAGDTPPTVRASERRVGRFRQIDHVAGRKCVGIAAQLSELSIAIVIPHFFGVETEPRGQGAQVVALAYDVRPHVERDASAAPTTQQRKSALAGFVCADVRSGALRACLAVDVPRGRFAAGGCALVDAWAAC